MRFALLYAPGDEDLAERKRAAIGADETLIAPLASSLAFGDRLVLVALWTHAATAYADVVHRLVDSGRGVLVWRMDGSVVPSAFEHAGLDSDASPRAIVSALRLAEMDLARAPREAAPPRRRGHGVLAVASGVVAVLALGAAGAAAFMLDGHDPIRLLGARDASAVPPGDDLRPTFDERAH